MKLLKLINKFCYLIVITLSFGVHSQENPQLLPTDPEFLPPPISADCSLPQALPIPTHWREGVGLEFGATGLYPISNPKLDEQLKNNDPIKYIYNFNILPTVNNYIGTNFSLSPVSDELALSTLKTFCEKSKQAYQIWKPESYQGKAAIDSILKSAPQKSGSVIIITGLTVSNSMFAVILPANWSPPSTSNPKPYPILFNGFYDLNDNFFRLEGKYITSLVSASLKKNKFGVYGTGAIGVLWNGAGAVASRTVNPNAYNDFQEIINLIENLGGDPHRIISFGASRGALTALQMASNPNPHNYTFRYVYAAVPPGHIGSIAAIASPTIPHLLTASDWSTGLADSHKRNFIYPNLGNGLGGLSGPESHAMVLTGTPNLSLADQVYSLGSQNMIDSLKKSGTQVYLEIGSHDFIVPGFDQLWLYNQYKAAGIPIELRINYLAGHYSDLHARQVLLEKSLKEYTHRRPQRHPTVINGARHFFKVDEKTSHLTSLATKYFLFTLELPRFLSPETKGIIFATGEPNTQYELTFNNPSNPSHQFINFLPRTINNNGFDIIEFDPRDFQPGQYHLTEVKIKKPNMKEWKNLDLSKRTYTLSQSNEPLIIENVATHPSGLTGAQTADLIFRGFLGNQLERVRGEFSSVNYGIIEAE